MRQNLAKWIGDYMAMLFGIIFILLMAAAVAWPIGLLCKMVYRLFNHGYGLW